MNPITMYAAVQIVGERRRATEARAQQRRLGRRAVDGASEHTPAGRVRWLHGHRRPATAADRAVA